MSTENGNNNGHFVSGDPRAKQFPPGTSGNPGGRPKGFASFIREETRGGIEMAEFALTVLHHGSLKQRQWAAEWLVDRAFGRPAQVNTSRTEDVDSLFRRVVETAQGLLSREDFDRLVEAWKAVGVAFDAELRGER